MTDIQKMIAAKRGLSVGKAAKKSVIRKRSDDYDYFELCHNTDPTFTRRDVIEEWTSAHPEEARQIIYNLCLDDDLNIWNDIEDMVTELYADKWDAFMAGWRAEVNMSDNYFTLDGYENIRSISDGEYEEMLRECIMNNIDKILDYPEELPEDLREILEIWDREVDYDDY